MHVVLLRIPAGCKRRLGHQLSCRVLGPTHRPQGVKVVRGSSQMAKVKQMRDMVTLVISGRLGARDLRRARFRPCWLIELIAW